MDNKSNYTDMSKNQLVNVKRSELAPTLASVLPGFVFWNAGKVTQVVGKRVCVSWNKEDKFWFDAEAVVKA